MQTSARIARSLERVEMSLGCARCGACVVTLLVGASAASAERRLAVIRTWRNARRRTYAELPKLPVFCMQCSRVSIIRHGRRRNYFSLRGPNGREHET